MKSNKDDWKPLISAAKKLKTIGQKYGLVVLMVAQNDKLAGAPWNYVVVIKKDAQRPKE